MNTLPQKPAPGRTKGESVLTRYSYATPEIMGYQRVNLFLERAMQYGSRL